MPLSSESTTHSPVILDKELAREVAHELLAISSIQLNIEKPFTWVSGIKAPVYCDNRRINSYVETRRFITSAFVKLIVEHFPEVEVIAGVATGGIPMGILVAERMDLPFIYVRQAPKEHGMMRQVEGECAEGSKVVLIEDHVSTGGSSMKAVNGLLNANLEVLTLISIMTYNFNKAIDLFRSNNIKHVSLSDLDTALEQAVKEKMLTTEQAENILAFREDPSSWKRNIAIK
jgi:orotate phosphoribosyltransferase